MLPLALLIILGLAGLRGAVTKPSWDGPLHRDGLVDRPGARGGARGPARDHDEASVGGQERRDRRGDNPGPPVNAVAAKLRGVLILRAQRGDGRRGGDHDHRPAPAPVHRKAPDPAEPRPDEAGADDHALAWSGVELDLPPAADRLLYALLIALLLAGIAISIWYARRLRPPIKPRADDFIAEDSENLRDAVESGRSALRTLDDARAAIIACYVAMENSLAERGAARAAADTPDELLARATETGITRGTAAARLTALFYEARFSSHPLDRSQRDAAAHALDELAAALAETGAGA